MKEHLIPCHMCGTECVYEALTHMNIYLIGSEGIRICHTCHKALTDVAKIIRRGACGY